MASVNIQNLLSQGVGGRPSSAPSNVEAKLREMQRFCGTGNWPIWFREQMDNHGPTGAWAALFMEAAEELEQRSRLAGDLYRRLAGG